MVAYLKKPTGSEGLQEIVDSLNGSHIRYALTKNLTIYVSLIEKFWQTATVRTVDNGEQEITATVDGKEFTLTEASVRRHLQLADADANGVKYHVPWTEVDQVFIPINEPKTHYFLVVLHIMSGVITLYDSLGVPLVEDIDWWIKMRLAFEAVIPTYLDECEVLKAKCIFIETYKVKFKVADNVPHPKEILWGLLAYWEHMVDYLWKYMIPEQRFKSIAKCG
uniref:Ubiquitin-like protease family profile domain-containing protein n=1 Tax=Tanacetum cinerariifolium TaxID=118510 RepID=A0A6L2J8Y2_TANCI|nr:hypothetical protein [Tanacetum cinerariifolium]